MAMMMITIMYSNTDVKENENHKTAEYCLHLWDVYCAKMKNETNRTRTISFVNTMEILEKYQRQY